MEAVVEGVCTNIEKYKYTSKTVRKPGVLDLTRPKAMSKIVYTVLHLHPHLLVDGFAKLGIDFHAILNYEELISKNDKSVGSGIRHYSLLSSPLVLDSEDRT